MASSGNIDKRPRLYRSYSNSSSGREGDDEGPAYELAFLEDRKQSHYSRLSRLTNWTARWSARSSRRPGRSRSPLARFSMPTVRARRRSIPYCAAQALALTFYFIISLVIIVGILFPSYSRPPRQYAELRRQIAQTAVPGRANVHNEKIFIVASIYDKNGRLLGGEWGTRLQELVDILGPDNVFLSIYENDADAQAQSALQKFSEEVSCGKSIVNERLDLSQLPHVITPSGVSRLKRIAFLVEVRNRALRPLEDPDSPAYSTRFDKILYVNDVFFNPTDAANLLFSTNVDARSGKTNYHAACAVDFINPFKFYDTFASRDTEGYRMGVPFYPWFSSAGNGTSRRDVLEQKDTVRVKSCWGGMVAFEAKWLQPRMHDAGIITSSPKATNASSSPITPALRFRAEPDTYWDSSECCLIHADLAELVQAAGDNSGESGIYMNPYVRVAYSSATLRWLPFTRRFERLYPVVQQLINRISARPGFNPRRTQRAGEHVVDRVWVWDEESKKALQHAGGGDIIPPPDGLIGNPQLNGSWQEVARTATAGQFCGMRGLLYINEHPKEGEGKWGFNHVP